MMLNHTQSKVLSNLQVLVVGAGQAFQCHHKTRTLKHTTMFHLIQKYELRHNCENKY